MAIPATLEIEVLEAGVEEVEELQREEGQKVWEGEVVMPGIRKVEQTARVAIV